ncbi:hypothetical protein AGRA3207_007852 (plasmid) [Actinomadura graeca]|uniref:Helix-turn-helix domain-containing protein n=1 Tax=Actinomadura graeca TaxID=2750812 RepID=A0ABX8R7K0_9ACTN|nr:hypothetical protein [Actinomadura graeca]QXJ27055.1 hypothetical protein AGRA3207_007852 [Actinomadura graeca]
MSAGRWRGLVGQVPEGARAAEGLAEVWRALAVDVRLHVELRRADGRRHVLAVARVLLERADWTTLESRPGHALIAAEVGVCPRTVARCVDLLHRWGYLSTREVGTTETIRAGRTRGRDPHRGQGNRAQTYRLCVPLWTTETRYQAAEGPHDGQVPKIRRVSAGHRPKPLNVHPSRPSRSEGQGRAAEISRLRRPDGYAGARVACGGAAVAAGRPTAGMATITARARRRAARPGWLDRTRSVAEVWQALPAELTGRLAGHEADRLAAELARQLDHRTPAELADRIARHWDYWRYKIVAEVTRSVAAVAFKIIRRDFQCPDVRCEDRWHLDQDAPCKACALAASERRAAHAPQGAAERPAAPAAACDPPAPSPPPVQAVLAELAAHQGTGPATGPDGEGPGAAEFRRRAAELRARRR